MKKIATLLTIAGTSLLLYAIPAMSEYGTPGMSEEYGTADQSGVSGQQMQKDECLLVAMNCNGTMDTVQQRIEKLRKEIDKGEAVYTPEELDKLNKQLDWLTTDGDTSL